MAESPVIDKKLRCVVVTPEKALLDAPADFIALPMFDGELGVLPGRAPMVGRLGSGELRIREGAETKRYFVDDGFVQIRSNTVTVLTARAMPAEKIDVEKAKADLEEARKAAPPEKQSAQLKAQERARTQIRTAERAKA